MLTKHIKQLRVQSYNYSFTQQTFRQFYRFPPLPDAFQFNICNSRVVSELLIGRLYDFQHLKAKINDVKDAYAADISVGVDAAELVFDL